VLAARVQLGTVFEGWSLRGATDFVPPQERLYAGGANSVRGYNQNLLGPTVYVVTEVDSSRLGPTGQRLYQAPDTANYRESPTGGNTLAVGNLEWRSGAPFLRDVFQLAAFVDAGLVWNRPRQTVHLGNLRVTPGVGVRVQSPVGPLRVDVAYNRYSHARGPAYFASGSTLRCVSPGNELDRGQIPAGSACPASFTPRQNDTFFSRLTFHFSIGQAF
jgi:outer membrane protein insertion porin family/translocation and assembly module TamA